MTNDELLSKTISYLRFPLTVGVVFIHFNLANGLNVHGIQYGLDNPEWYFFIPHLISGVLPVISVPLFFIISGFLFFYRADFDKGVYTQKLRTRTRTLLVPYLLWNVIAIVWVLKCFLPYFSSFYRPVEIQLSFARIVNTFLCNTDNRGIFVGSPRTWSITGLCPIDGPLWYVRELMLMVVLSPVIYWLVKKTKQWFVVLTGLIWFFSSIILPRGNYYIYIYTGTLASALFFFSWGAFYSIFKENIVLSFRKFRYAPVVYIPIAIVDALTKGLGCNEYIGKVGILVGVVAAVVLVSYLLESNKVKVNSNLSNSSFFIFALHMIFIRDMGKLLFTTLHISGNNPYAMLALYFAVPILTILVCLALYMLLKRYAPKVCSLLTGGR